jgi:hypothetical protein
MKVGGLKGKKDHGKQASRTVRTLLFRVTWSVRSLKVYKPSFRCCHFRLTSLHYLFVFHSLLLPNHVISFVAVISALIHILCKFIQSATTSLAQKGIIFHRLFLLSSLTIIFVYVSILK